MYSIFCIGQFIQQLFDSSQSLYQQNQQDPAAVQEDQPEDIDPSTLNDMTPELWQKLAEMSSREHYLVDYNQTSPEWISTLTKMKYLKYEDWGAGSRYDRYTISERGKQALAIHRANRPES